MRGPAETGDESVNAPASADARQALHPGEDPLRKTPLELFGYGMATVGGLLLGWVVLIVALNIFVAPFIDRSFDAGLAAPFGIGLALAVIGVNIAERLAATSATVQRRQPYRAEVAARRRAAYEAAEAARQAERARLVRDREDQFAAWDYDVTARDVHRWPPRGFTAYDVIHGTTAQGLPAPAYSTLHLQLAPPHRPDLAARIAPHQPGPPIDIPIHDVIQLAARSRGAAWFGFGASGAMAAHVASSLDRHLAGYELVLVTTSGFHLRLRVLGGAPPEAELDTISARAAGSPF